MRLRALLTIAILSVAGAAGAAPPLAQLDALHEARAAADARSADAGALADLANAQIFAGDTAGALATMDRKRMRPAGAPAPSDADRRALDSVQADDAIRMIVAAARSKRAVLINEDHTVAMHRAFTQKLALALRKIGYRYFAAEAFNAPVLSNGRYLSWRDGYYTRDPVFAGLVRSLQSSGFTLVGYDIEEEDPAMSPRERIAFRERSQARNIHDRIFARDPDAKVLIHVGHHHLGKRQVGDIKPMGAHLRELIGADASLHVDQLAFYARSTRAAEDPLYRTLLDRLAPAAPMALRQADGASAAPRGLDGFVDMHILHPDYGLREGRPAWLSVLAARTPTSVPKALLPQAGERLVLAVDREHGEDAVPVDALLLAPGKPAPPFMLPPGQFRFEVQQ